MSPEAHAQRLTAFAAALESDETGFDGVPPQRFLALRTSLLDRRFREARRLAPALDRWLGPRFETLFRAWMRIGPRTGTPLTELLGFAAGLSELPDAVADELSLLRRRTARRWRWW